MKSLWRPSSFPDSRGSNGRNREFGTKWGPKGHKVSWLSIFSSTFWIQRISICDIQGRENTGFGQKCPQDLSEGRVQRRPEQWMRGVRLWLETGRKSSERIGSPLVCEPNCANAPKWMTQQTPQHGEGGCLGAPWRAEGGHRGSQSLSSWGERTAWAAFCEVAPFIFTIS